MRILAEHALLPGGWASKVLVAFGADGQIASVAPASGETPDMRVATLAPAVSSLHTTTRSSAPWRA